MERTTESEVRAMFCTLIDLGYDAELIRDGWTLRIKGKVPPFALIPLIYYPSRNGKLQTPAKAQ